MTSTGLRAGLLAVLIGVGAVVALSVDLPDVSVVRGWLAGAGPAGWAALVAGVALVLLTPVPRTAVSVLVGLVTGFAAGLAVALAGGVLAAAVAFGLSRALGRPAVTRLGGRRVEQVDRLLRGRGFVAVLTGRLVPMVPFVVLSYAAGLTAVRLGPYLLATALGMLPSTVVQVGLGASAGTFDPWTLAGAAVVAGAVLVVVLRRRRTTTSPS
ncbi:MAG TPA: VTT domain-containing protein [Blastococcus sp.]|nr:VTT domain-containing protein [Blastococcus sp.]